MLIYLFKYINIKPFKMADDEKIMAAFKKYDLNHNSFIELDELKMLLNDLAKSEGFPLPKDREIAQIFKDFDINSDNLISYSEFKDMYKVLSEMK